MSNFPIDDNEFIEIRQMALYRLCSQFINHLISDSKKPLDQTQSSKQTNFVGEYI